MVCFSKTVLALTVGAAMVASGVVEGKENPLIKELSKRIKVPVPEIEDPAFTPEAGKRVKSRTSPLGLNHPQPAKVTPEQTAEIIAQVESFRKEQNERAVLQDGQLCNFNEYDAVFECIDSLVIESTTCPDLVAFAGGYLGCVDEHCQECEDFPEGFQSLLDALIEAIEDAFGVFCEYPPACELVNGGSSGGEEYYFVEYPEYGFCKSGKYDEYYDCLFSLAPNLNNCDDAFLLVAAANYCLEEVCDVECEDLADLLEQEIEILEDEIGQYCEIGAACTQEYPFTEYYYEAPEEYTPFCVNQEEFVDCVFDSFNEYFNLFNCEDVYLFVATINSCFESECGRACEEELETFQELVDIYESLTYEYCELGPACTQELPAEPLDPVIIILAGVVLLLLGLLLIIVGCCCVQQRRAARKSKNLLEAKEKKSADPQVVTAASLLI